MFRALIQLHSHIEKYSSTHASILFFSNNIYEFTTRPPLLKYAHFTI